MNQRQIAGRNLERFLLFLVVNEDLCDDQPGGQQVTSGDGDDRHAPEVRFLRPSLAAGVSLDFPNLHNPIGGEVK